MYGETRSASAWSVQGLRASVEQGRDTLRRPAITKNVALAMEGDSSILTNCRERFDL